MKGRSPVPWEVWELRPMIEAGGAEHWGIVWAWIARDVRVPPGVGMFASLPILRNVSRAKKRRPRQSGKIKKQRGRGHYEGRSPKAPARLMQRSGRDGGGKPQPDHVLLI